MAAVAPGDEHAECEVPDYPSGIRVLLDSWRYQTLLAPSSSDMGMDPSANQPVWLTDADLSHTNSTSDTVRAYSYNNYVLIISIHSMTVSLVSLVV